jgi:hypothetical protein
MIAVKRASIACFWRGDKTALRLEPAHGEKISAALGLLR